MTSDLQETTAAQLHTFLVQHPLRTLQPRPGRLDDLLERPTQVILEVLPEKIGSAGAAALLHSLVR